MSELPRTRRAARERPVVGVAVGDAAGEVALVAAECDLSRPPSVGVGAGGLPVWLCGSQSASLSSDTDLQTQCNAQMSPNIMKKYINVIQWGVIYIENK